MIEVLKDDAIVDKLGGRFKLTALIQRRLVQLMHGARPMVDDKGLTLMELVVREIMEDKIRPKAPMEESSADDEA
ncbi:MAG: DNA-directed RNA polymerase subunit omega [Planctomycetota bacterium]